MSAVAEKEQLAAAEKQTPHDRSDTESPDLLINSSGHVQELQRNFNLWSVAGMGIVTGSVWPAAGGSILVAIFNGGPPGVLYEFITVAIFFVIVSACIAELASAMPSSGGPYHWASVTPGKKWGRVIGFFAGYWNWLAWVLGGASMSSIFANTVVQMYALAHPDFESKAWHVFVVYIIITWITCLTVCLANKALPWINYAGIFFIIAGFFITVIVVAVMPGRGGRPPHATSSFVWKEWQADIGYSNGFVFVAGMLNGAYAVGTPTCSVHLAEEIPFPQKYLPIAIAVQMVIGIVTGFCYLVAILYAINDFEALFDSPFPLAEIYLQATQSTAGAIGLLCLLTFCVCLTLIGCYVDAGRCLWSLARDGATPFSARLATVNPKLNMPFNSTISCAVLVTILGCIYLGSTTAFNAFVGSFALMLSAAYIAAILPHLLTGRKNIGYGPFQLKGMLGYIMNFVACGYMIVWFVIYSFPFALPVNAQSMNYASLIWGGLTIFVATWWFVGGKRGYVGPTATGGVICEGDLVREKGGMVNVQKEVVARP